MDMLRRIFGLGQAEPTGDTTGKEGPLPQEDPDRPQKSAEFEEPVAGPFPGHSPLGGTRQLPPLETALTRPNQHIIYGQSSDVGMVRNANQDAILTFFVSQGNADNVPDLGLFVVADGMGGHHDGEKASAIAANVVAEQVTRKIFLPTLGQEQKANSAEQPTVSEILVEAVKTANEVVVKSIPEGGTTITAAAVIGDLAYIVHVGDSRAYLISKERGPQYEIEQITRDHSLVQRLIELDQLTPDEAAQHPQKNVLYRAIGQSDSLEVDTITRRLPADSYLLLCSDGLWNMVPEEKLLEAITSAASPQLACDRLVALANEAGGSDNISAILLRVPG